MNYNLNTLWFSRFALGILCDGGVLLLVLLGKHLFPIFRMIDTRSSYEHLSCIALFTKFFTRIEGARSRVVK